MGGILIRAYGKTMKEVLDRLKPQVVDGINRMGGVSTITVFKPATEEATLFKAVETNEDHGYVTDIEFKETRELDIHGKAAIAVEGRYGKKPIGEEWIGVARLG